LLAYRFEVAVCQLRGQSMVSTSDPEDEIIERPYMFIPQVILCNFNYLTSRSPFNQEHPRV